MEGAASIPLDGWTIWEFPGKPVRVRLSPGVVGRLAMAVRLGADALPGRGLESGGLLIGSRTETDNPVVIQVYDFEPVKCEHAAGPSYLLSDRDRLLLASRIAAHAATCKNSSIVGIYRSHTRPDFAITEEDVALFSTYFKKASDVFLLIKPSDGGTPTAGFIIREEGKVVSKSPYVQFPLQGTLIRHVREIPLPPLRASEERPPARPVVPQPPVPVPQPSALRRTAARAAFWLPAVGVMALAVGLYWGIPSRGPGSVPAKPVSPAALNVAFLGDSLRLSWDPQISKRADHAAVWIMDGLETLRLDLDSKQLSEGSVVYRPRHSEVEFRFETLSPGARSTESVRAIRPSQAAVAVQPAPATIAVESPPVSPAAPKTPPREPPARTVSAPERPHPSGIRTASRQVFSASVLPRAENASAAAAAISLPDPPAIQPAVVTPPSSGKDVLKLVASANRPDSTDLPVRVTVEPVLASRRSFPILKRSVRPDYVPPATLRDPGLLSPPHRSVARNTNIDVKVYVNPSGKVDYSEVLSEVAASNRDLAALAVFSARRWEFVPARTRDGTVPGEVILHYQFGPGAVR